MRRFYTSAVLLTPVNRPMLRRLTLRTHVRAPWLIELALWSLCIFLLTNPFTFQLMGTDPSAAAVRNVATMRRESGSQTAMYLLREGILIAAFASAFLRWKLSSRAWPRIYPALPFLGWAILSVAWADSPDSTAHGVAALVPLVLCGFLMSLRLAPHHAARVLIYSGALVAFSSLYFIIAMPRFGMHQFSDASQSVHIGSWRGVYLHKNHLGQTAAIYATAILLAGKTVLPNRFVKWGLFALMLLIIIKSSSASALAIVPVAAGIVILVICMTNFQQFFALLAATFAAVIGILSVNILLSALGRDATLSGRTRIWELAFSSIGERPLNGYGFMSSTYGEFTYNVARFMGVFDPHNGFIDITLGLGVIGLALLFLSIIAAYRVARRIFRVGGSFRQGAVVLAAVMTAWIIGNLTESNCRPMGAVAALGFVSMGMLLALPRPRHFKVLAPVELKMWQAAEPPPPREPLQDNDYATR